MNYQQEKQYSELLNLILQQTRNGNIQWTPSSIADTYLANIGIGSVTIFNDSDPSQNIDQVPIASLSFRNERGETFNSIVCYDEYDPDYPRLSELYQLAHDSYMKTDETIQSMFSDLTRPPKSPF